MILWSYIYEYIIPTCMIPILHPIGDPNLNARSLTIGNIQTKGLVSVLLTSPLEATGSCICYAHMFFTCPIQKAAAYVMHAASRTNYFVHLLWVQN